jgi:hypothetical protein
MKKKNKNIRDKINLLKIANAHKPAFEKLMLLMAYAHCKISDFCRVLHIVLQGATIFSIADDHQL